MSLSVCAEWGLSIISWMFKLMALVAIHQGEVWGVSKGVKLREWAEGDMDGKEEQLPCHGLT